MLKNLNKLLNFLSTIASFALFYLLNSDLLNKKIQTLLHILTYSLIRQQRFFNIIEFMCKLIIELQIKFLIIYFRD